MGIMSFQTTGLRLQETPEMTEDANAALMQVGHWEMIECMAVLRATIVGPVNHGIKTSGTGTSGEQDHETISVEILSTTTRAMVEEGIGEIAPTTLWIVAEATGISVMDGLELETKATGVMKDSKNPMIEEVAIAVGRDEIII